MSCKCQQPKKMKNSAGGVDFYVCAKSLGGCGQEIGSKWQSKTWDAGGGILTPEIIENASKKALQSYGNINPHKPKVIECPECYGGGMVAKLYPNGHTEVSCEYCDGIGEVEL